MNTERLHALAIAVQNEISTIGLVSQFQALVQALQELASNPGDVNRQTRLSAQRKSFADALVTSPSNDWPPLWRQALDDLSIADLLGKRLSDQIDHVINEDRMTPAVATQQLSSLQQRTTQLQQSITSLNAAFQFLGIGEEKLRPGECEIAVLIPRGFVKNHLQELGNEFDELNDILAPFAELATGTREGFEVKAIASSEFAVYILASPFIVEAFANAVGKILAVYRQYLDIREMRSHLANKGVPDEAVEGLSKFVDAMIAQRIPEIAHEVMTECNKSVSGTRVNELEVDLKFRLHEIAARIDRGFNFQVTAEPPDEDANDVAQAKAVDRAVFERIKTAGREMQFLRADGEPILKLPDTNSDRERDSR